MLQELPITHGVKSKSAWPAGPTEADPPPSGSPSPDAVFSPCSSPGALHSALPGPAVLVPTSEPLHFLLPPCKAAPALWTSDVRHFLSHCSGLSAHPFPATIPLCCLHNPLLDIWLFIDLLICLLPFLDCLLLESRALFTVFTADSLLWELLLLRSKP